MNSGFSLDSLLRENIKNIKPYSTARDEYTGVALINLDANENPYGSVGGSQNNRYPDPYQTPLKKEIAKIKNVPSNQIFLGNGSDEAIDLLYTAFCNPGKDKTIVCPPTYGMYEVSAATNDVKCIEIPLTKDYKLQTDAILSACDETVKIIWICSPNNPTGNLISKNEIEKILTNFDGIVAIDEAYIDFAEQASWTTELGKYPNLVVLQTFSKAWGLANIRLGMLFAQKDIISIINKIKLPYNLSGLVQDFALNLLQNSKDEKDSVVNKIIEQRTKLTERLLAIPEVEKVHPSDANFVLAVMPKAHEAYLYLVEQGIIVRDRTKVLLCENSLRITVGTQEENDSLLEKLSQFFSK